MSTTRQVLSDLEPLFRGVLEIPDLVLEEHLTAKDVAGWNSLNHMRILSAAEQHFAVRLTAAEIVDLKSAGELAALIASKLEK